jgi:lipocalin
MKSNRIGALPLAFRLSLVALSLLCVVAMASSDNVFRSEDLHKSSGSEAPLHPPSASMDGVSMAVEFGSSRPEFGHKPSSISRRYDGYHARPTAGCQTSSTLAVPGLSPSAAFCQNPPVVPDLDISIYGNSRYYNIYNSGSALRVSSNRCVTANYSLLLNSTVDVLNCQARGPGQVKPTCVTGSAKARANATKAAQLQVQFPKFPASSANPGTYNVVALLGSRKSGYHAAAVYGCGTLIPSLPPLEPGIYILSKTLANPEKTLEKLKRKLKCKGFDVSVKFRPVDHTNCAYFFEPTGFTIF